ncbi:MAG: hypothetical protein NC350_02280 [Corallococcus sp.]|nr:hypothetical protein [Corallococcus sp.]
MYQPKILVTYIESGFGHIMSAQSISESLKQKYAGKLDIVEAEIMRDDENQTLIKFEKFLTNQTKATNKLWHYGDLMFAFLNLGKSYFMKLVHHTLFKKAVDSVVEAFALRKPDVIISTHYFITFAAIEYKRRCAPETVVVTYNPDNNVHVWWDNRSDVFITNNSKASTEAIRKRKFDYTTVKQVYFTAREAVQHANLTKREYREIYGIPQDKFCIMIADGGYAGGKALSYCKHMIKTKKPLTVVLLAGKNEKAYNKFALLAKTTAPNVTLIVERFTEKVYELYAACDMLITKAGPNTIMDSLYVGTPIMIDKCPHPIERASYRLFVKSMGCGAGAFNKRRARKLIESYIDNPSLLDEFKNNISANIDKSKNGADQIADIVYQKVADKIEE